MGAAFPAPLMGATRETSVGTLWRRQVLWTEDEIYLAPPIRLEPVTEEGGQFFEKPCPAGLELIPEHVLEERDYILQLLLGKICPGPKFVGFEQYLGRQGMGREH